MAKKSTSKTVGRPKGSGLKYGSDTYRKVLALLKHGRTLSAISRMEGMPVPAVVIQKTVDDEAFAAQYARARQIGYSVWADELMDVADDARNDWMEREDPENPGWQFNGEHFQRSRLRIDTRKWMLAKMLPKVYGDKQEVTAKHEGGLSINVVTGIERPPGGA